MAMQHQQTVAPVSVFYSYAHEDEPLREQLEKHLSLLRRQGLISDWHDREILPGTEWSREIDEHLETASIILLLISPDFLASDYCYGIEMQRSLQQHQANEARVIPILLRPVDWRGAPFERIQVLPTNAQPITTWRNRDQAFADVAAGIRQAIEDLAFLSASTPHTALPSVSSQPSQTDQLTDAPLQKLEDHLKTLDLPVQPTPFIGREQEIAEVTQLLSRDDVRLLTLTGPGGSGKTRLGLQVTIALRDSFPDGACFVALAPITDPDLVIPTLFQKLGLQERRGQSLLEHLKEYLQQKQVLLLLDNFEQVVSAAGQVADLLAACPKLKIVVTSREVLHVRAEHECVVPPLALPDLTRLPDLEALAHYAAVALFIQRSQVVKPGFQLTIANAPTVVEICTRLDGLPLAIELAAARMKLLSPKALLMRLSPRLPILTSEIRDVPARQQTLRNTIAWSYQLLDAQEQRLLRRLCIFVGGCTLEAVETLYTSLGGGDGSVFDGVTSLIDKSLLRQTEQTEEEPHLMMLETIREYGLECLATSGEMELTRRAHAAYYLAVAEEAVSQLGGPRQVEWLKRLEREHDNLRAVMQWVLEPGRQEEQRLEMALRLGAALGRFWFARGPFHEGQIFLERTLVGSEGIVSSWRAKALIAAGWLEGDAHRRDELYGESLAIFRALGDKQGICSSLYWLSLGALDRGNPTEASAMLEECMQLQRELGDTGNLANSLFFLARVAAYQGDYARASALSEESLALHRKREDTRGITSTLLYLAEISFSSHGDPATVRPLIEESLTLAKQVGDTSAVAYCLTFLGWVELSQGNAPLARSLVEKSIALCREMGLPPGGVWVLGPEVVTKVAAEHVVKRAAAQGDHATARAHLEEGVTLARELGAQLALAAYLDGLASVVATQGALTWAARFWGAAQSLREASGLHLVPDLCTGFVYEQAIPTARSQLGEEAFAAAWAEGRTMTTEQALASLEQVTFPDPLSAPSSPSA
jgi:predicted ATPase